MPSKIETITRVSEVLVQLSEISHEIYLEREAKHQEPVSAVELILLALDHYQAVASTGKVE